MADPSPAASPRAAPAAGGAPDGGPLAADTATGTGASRRTAAPASSQGLAAPGLVVARKLATGMLGVVVFVLAIELLKAGADSVTPVVRDVLQVHDPVNAFGFGWVGAYAVLSGSPVAATALGLFAAGVLDPLGTFAMIGGSRFGAAFVVLFIGFLYTVRHTHRHHRHLSLQAGILSLLVTWLVYGPGLLVGLVLLRTGALASLTVETPPRVVGFLDATVGAAAERVAALAPHPALVFVAGIAAVLAAFKLFDLALPDIQRRAGRLGRMAERIYRPSVLFAFGAGVTVLTLSVSVSLGLLVPLTVKGVIRRENLIPYIMGANVTTFVDTLLAAVVIGGATAFTVVLAGMLGVLVVSVVVIAFAYGHFEDALYRLSHAILASRRRLALFLIVILICPMALLLL